MALLSRCLGLRLGHVKSTHHGTQTVREGSFHSKLCVPHQTAILNASKGLLVYVPTTLTTQVVCGGRQFGASVESALDSTGESLQHHAPLQKSRRLYRHKTQAGCLATERGYFYQVTVAANPIDFFDAKAPLPKFPTGVVQDTVTVAVIVGDLDPPSRSDTIIVDTAICRDVHL